MTNTKQPIHIVLTAQDSLKDSNDRVTVADAENLSDMELQKSKKLAVCTEKIGNTEYSELKLLVLSLT